MNAIAVRAGEGFIANDNAIASLPALVRRASTALANATTAAEVLEAKAVAGVAYDAAKAAARFAKAKGAYEDVISAVYRAQADALEIEAQAKRRLADEYDAAQARGEIGIRTGRPKVVANEDELKPATIEEAGFHRRDLHKARVLRDAADEYDGGIPAAIECILESGIEPTRAALNRELNARLGSYSGDNEWYTPSRYIEMARAVMGDIDVDPASNNTAQRTILAAEYYTEETDGLSKEWYGRVWMNPPYSNPEVQQFTEKLLTEFMSGRTTEAIVLTNNSADTGWHRALQDRCTLMCTTTGRIRFESPTRQGNSPAMGQSFFYFGDQPEKFKEVFSAIGNIWMLA